MQFRDRVSKLLPALLPEVLPLPCTLVWTFGTPLSTFQLTKGLLFRSVCAAHLSYNTILRTIPQAQKWSGLHQKVVTHRQGNRTLYAAVS